MSDVTLSLQDFEKSLHEMTPLEKKLKAIQGRGQIIELNISELIAGAKKELIEEGYSLYAQQYEPVDIQDGFITYTDKSEITAIYQSRYLPVYTHKHDFIEAIYVYEGQCSLITDQNCTLLKKGDFCIVSPAFRHDHNVMDDTSIILLIAIKCDTFNNTLSVILSHNDILSDFFLKGIYNSLAQSGILFQTDDDRQIASTILEMQYERSIKGDFYDLMLSNLFTRLLLLLLRNHQESAEIIENISNEKNLRLIPILRDIQTNLHKVSLESLSIKYGYSITKLSRQIKKHTGKSFMEIVRELKAKRSAKLLENPNLNMLDIVEMVGYYDVSHMYKDFRWYFHTTPKEYRKSHMDVSIPPLKNDL